MRVRWVLEGHITRALLKASSLHLPRGVWTSWRGNAVSDERKANEAIRERNLLQNRDHETWFVTTTHQ